MTTQRSISPPGIRFRIRGLSRGDHPVNLEASAELLDMEPFVGKIEISGKVGVSEYFHFLLQLKGVAIVNCDRCGKEIDRTVESDSEVFFVPEGMEGPSGDFVEVFPYDPHGTQELDLTDVVRDNLLLAIPMKNLCDEDCAGIPTEHWEPDEPENKALLRSLYDKLREQEMNDGSK